MKKFLLFLSLLVGFQAFALSSSAWARSVIVHVAIIDGISITKSSVESVNSFLKANEPGQKIINATVVDNKLSVLGRSQEELRADLIAQMHAQLAPGDEVAKLIINTHGSTFNSPEFGYTTGLSYIGSFNANGVDNMFKEMFAELKGRMSDDAAIVFDSCSTLCGPEDQTSARAKAVLDFLEVKNGAVYGSIVTEMFVPGAMNRNVLPREWFLSTHLIKIMVPLVFLNLMLHDIQHPVLTGNPLASLLERGTVDSLLTYLAASILPNLAAIVSDLAGVINKGKILVFKNGVVTDVISVKKHKERFRVYAITNRATCPGAVASLGGEKP